MIPSNDYIYNSFISLNLRIADLHDAAGTVEKFHAPPATVMLQFLVQHFHMPTAFLFMLSFPQKVHVYLACCEISIFLTVLRREAPYRVPYLPTTPTFLVRFAILLISKVSR